ATSSEALNMVRGIVLPDYQKSEKYHSAHGSDDKEQDKELPDPIPLRKTLSDVMPFTEDLLPPALSHFVFDEADRMPASPSFVGVSLLTALGSIIGASCGIKPKQKDDWLIVPNLWGGIVANPTQKKTPAIDSGMRILNCVINEAQTDYENALKQYKKDVLSYDTDLDSLKSELKSSANPNAKKTPKHTKEELIDLICKMEEEAPCPPMLRRYKTNDSTVAKLGELEQQNPNGILVLRDELIGLLSSLDKEGNEGDRAFYLEGFNGTGSYDTDRIGRGHIYIQNHCLSVFGGIQPDKLIAYLEQAYSGLGNDGLLQRFQLLVYPDPIEWQYRDRYPNHEAFKAVLEIFSRLSSCDFVEFGAYPIDEYNKRPYFRFTLDAQEFYVNWTYQLNAQKIPNEENTIIQQHLGKYDRLLPALALIFHLVDCVSNHTQGQVGLESIKRAALWCEYLETHARRIYGLLLDG
ncbi:MAG TPA: YfjI family protein, partial [Agitococcus sp.]|nr:YfjI family protein [Agitococcus sp.]